VKLRLSEAAISALECAGFELDDDPSPIQRAWTKRDVLEFDADEAEALFSALNEQSNNEDAQAQNTNCDPDVRKYARRAASALATVAGKVLRMGEAQS